MKKIIPLLFTAVAVGCASSELPRNTPVEAVKDTTTVEAKYAANELGAREVAEVRFAHGSNRLDAKSAKKIRQALQSASKLGTAKPWRCATASACSTPRSSARSKK